LEKRLVDYQQFLGSSFLRYKPMQQTVPEKLFQRATTLGFQCYSHQGVHRISPPDPEANWYLVYQRGAWTLEIAGIPQMNLLYAEVGQFLERRALSEVA
jgi:hypothetical protein